MATATKILIAVVMMLATYVHTQAQNAVAVSSNPGAGLHVALNWAPFPGAVKYNIFRKNDGAPAYPGTPLNTMPVQVLSNCVTIRSTLITTPDSIEWKIVAKALSGPPPAGLFNPCLVNTLTAGSEKQKRLHMLARSSMPIAIVAGLAYRDNSVVNGTSYRYQIVALNASNAVIGTVATDLLVTAGTFTPLAAPANVIAEPGDDDVLVRWDSVSGAAGYVIERAPAIAGIYRRVNESNFTSKVTNKLNGDTLIPATNGFLDFKRYTVLHGKDSFHVVNGFDIYGPKNNTKYYYRIRTLDLFMRAGPTSAVFGPVIPRDSSDPSIPLDLSAIADDSTGHVTIRWQQVVKDINGHWEYPDSTIKYKLYRFTSSDNPNTAPSTFVGEVLTKGGLKFRDTTDTDPSLRSAYGNRTWWYRLRAVDQATNLSQWSSAVSAIVKDTTKPNPPIDVETKGFEASISVKWKPNTEPDIASYMIYRSLCHLGDWVECNPKDTCRTWQTYDPKKYFDEKDDPKPNGLTSPNAKTGAAADAAADGGTIHNPFRGGLPCPCSGPFIPLGEIPKDSVERALAAGNFFFTDSTIPKGSPLCYAYWIKAKDSSGNTSGSYPIPSAAEKMQIKCERLRDRTPPTHAIISGLFAQAEQIKVEWIGPPTQDTRAYHVYRATGANPADEPKSGDYKWAGGMTVELPPTMPQVLTEPYKPPSMATCDKISVQATPWMSQGFFEDKNIEPKLTYWYKVVGIDYDGNETSLDSAAAISTFSFTRKALDSPQISSINIPTDPCVVVLNCSPVFDASRHAGFIVYRSTNAAGPFLPVVVSPVKGNSFTDSQVVKGVTYHYAVALLMLNGRLSPLSPVQSITP
jgi:fibronectin type 3 domain-containing protein